jgi:hypothetical protein
MTVLIAGGGIGGLTLALSLHQIGVAAKVFESVPALKTLGVGINVLPHAVRELRISYPPGPRLRLFTFLALCAASILADSSGACAAPWEKLPDGRVIIQVKDVRLALPADGADTNDVEFSDRHQIKNRMTLRDVIVDPERARKLFSSTNLINVVLPNLIERQGLYLEKFLRSDFRSFEAGLAIGEGALTSCESWATRFARLKASLAPDDPRIGPSGWAKFQESKSPMLLAYVRTPLDVDHLNFFPGISCDYFSICGSNKCVGTDVSVSYRFSGKVIKQENWRNFEVKAYELFKYLLIDLVK